jgi:hypothetical protein
MSPRPDVQSAMVWSWTEPLHETPLGVPQVQEVQLRVSAYDAYETCLFGNSGGHKRSPDAYTHMFEKEGGGLGAQSLPTPQPPSTSVPSHAFSALVQLAAGVVGTPPVWVQDPPLGDEELTAKYSGITLEEIWVQTFPETVAWKIGVSLHGIFVAGVPHHATFGLLHETPVGAPQLHGEQVAGLHVRPELPMTLVFGYGAAHVGGVPALASPS